MSDLSERELLLLSNYLYMDISTTQGSVLETLSLLKNETGFDEIKIAESGIGGGLDAAQAKELFEEMDKAGAAFENLEAVRTIDEGGIRAVCFAEQGSSEAAVIFRGTGGEYYAWTDNVQGEYQSDTDMQKLAADFVTYNCGVYDNITVSGHSKGGNLAQYVTVQCPDQVERCISYDGQGFGEAFLKQNKDAVALAANKITAINAHNDFVNILLTPIAGKRIFVENEGRLVDAHSSYWLLKSNRFDERGSFTSITNQAMSMQALENATALLVKQMDALPFSGNRLVSNLLAAVLAGIMSQDQTDALEMSETQRAAGALCGYTAALFKLAGAPNYEAVKLHTQKLSLTVPGTRNACMLLEAALQRTQKECHRLEEIRNRSSYSMTARLYTDRTMMKIQESLYGKNRRLLGMSQLLREIIFLYEQKELKIAAMMERSDV